MTNRYYEKLVKTADTNVPYDLFVRRIVPALGLTLLPALVESIRRKQAIDTGIVLEDFRFFIKRYLMYKRYESPTTETQDVKRGYTGLGELLRKLDEQPELYKQQLRALERAVDSFKDERLKEDKTTRELAELANAISVWILDYVIKNKLPIIEEESWPNLKSYMKKLKEVQEEMGYPVTISPSIEDVESVEPS